MITTIIAWVLSHIDWLPWLGAGIATGAAVIFKAIAGKHKKTAQAATKGLKTIEDVKGFAKDAKKTGDSDLANRLTKRR